MNARSVIMTDATAVLRAAIIRGESLNSDSHSIIVGGKARLDRKSTTNLHSMRGRGPPYSLEAIYFQFKHHQLPYNDYVTECNREKVPHVTLVDKKELIAYLKGDVSECACLVATSGTAQALPLEAADAALTADGEESHKPADSTSNVKKRARPDTLEKEDLPGDVVAVHSSGPRALASKYRDQRALDAVMCVESWDFSALRDKLGKHIEQTRAAIASGKGVPGLNAGSAQRTISSRARDGQAYDPRGDRYTAPDDRFWRENMGSDFYEMGIDPSGSFKASGTTTPATNGANRDRRLSREPQRRPDHVQHDPPTSTRSEVSAKDHTPIIVVPISMLSMLTFHNAREFLENGSFVSMQEMRSRGGMATAALSSLTIVRRPGGKTSSAKYELVCNPRKLTSSEWKRVVGVVCTGQGWQFKNWPWWENDEHKKGDNGVSDIFRNMCGFVFHYDDTAPPPETKNWAVKILALSRTKRHNDVKVQTQFWESIDAFCKVHKRNLLY
jgi:RNA pol II accessory factor, Cdc73 family, C-terminal/Paf1 complex subunit CDC73 N-terminal